MGSASQAAFRRTYPARPPVGVRLLWTPTIPDTWLPQVENPESSPLQEWVSSASATPAPTRGEGEAHAGLPRLAHQGAGMPTLGYRNRASGTGWMDKRSAVHSQPIR